MHHGAAILFAGGGAIGSRRAICVIELPGRLADAPSFSRQIHYGPNTLHYLRCSKHTRVMTGIFGLSDALKRPNMKAFDFVTQLFFLRELGSLRA